MRFSVFFLLMLAYVNGGSLYEFSEREKIIENYLKTNYDFIMDLILTEVRHYLKTHHETIIVIPPMNKSFDYYVMGFPVTASFKTTEGTFTNPATVHRKGDVRVEYYEMHKVKASMNVSFNEMEVRFPKYFASQMGITESGAINVSMQKNLIAIEVEIDYLPQCTITISKVNIEELKDINVNMTGLGVLTPLEDEIVSWILDSYKNTFTDIIMNVIKNKIRHELVITKICKLKKTPMSYSDLKMKLIKHGLNSILI